MRQIICDGCKTGEEIKGDARAGKDIKQVEMEIWEDERSSVPRVPIKADLCGKCRQEMLNGYFRQTVDTTEAFIEPQSLKADFVPAGGASAGEISGFNEVPDIARTDVLIQITNLSLLGAKQ